MRSGRLGRPPLEGGFWMTEMLARLKKRTDLELAVVTVAGPSDLQFAADGVEYFVVGRPWRRALQGRLGLASGARPVKSQIRKYATIVNRWNPDVVHCHGTELDYGLVKAWRFTDKPFGVSIQGLMAPYFRKAYGDLLPAEVSGIAGSLTGFGASCMQRWKSFRDRMPVEEQILRSADMVLGRTEWDQAWAWAFDPAVRYRHVNELMRPEMLCAEPWSVAGCQPYRLFCTTGAQPLKGLHVLLDAVRRPASVVSGNQVERGQRGICATGRERLCQVRVPPHSGMGTGEDGDVPGMDRRPGIGRTIASGTCFRDPLLC